MAYRRAALVATGGFDERFPRAFREDSDLALRTVRLGYVMTWGERVTTHPLASPTNWRSSLKDQAGNADNAWLRAKYGRRWRSLIRNHPGRTGRHLITTAAATTALAAVASRQGCARAPQLGARRGGGWACLGRADGRVRDRSDPCWTTDSARNHHDGGHERPHSTPRSCASAARGGAKPGLAGRGPRAVVLRTSPAAVLFDRDGTLIENVPYLADPRRVRPMPGARRTLDQLRRQGVAVGVVSNQSGVARG